MSTPHAPRLPRGHRHAALGLAMLLAGCTDCDADGMTRPPTPTTAAEAGIVSPTDAPPPIEGGFEGWTVGGTVAGGLSIEHDFTALVKMKHVAFGPGWRWIGPEVSADDEGFTMQTQLAARGRGTIRRRSPRELAIELSWDVAEPLTDIKGIGMQFDIELGSKAWPQAETKPVLLPDNGGFSVSVAPRESVDVRWNGPGRVFFERQNPRQVRIMMLEGAVAKGHYEGTLEIVLPSTGRVRPSIAERYGESSAKDWPPAPVAWDDWPVDVSFLSAADRPAGKRGRVVAKGDHLEFADGTPARFWGTNVSANALFAGTPDAVRTQARRLAALGFNLVRLHHHDSAWTASNVFEPGTGNTKQLRTDALERLDWWIKCLTDEGIYVWIDLHVGRRFEPGDDIEGYGELVRAHKGEAKGFNYVNPTIEAAMQRFAAEYLGHVGEHTKQPWARHPGVLAVLVTNENDLSDHFGAAMLPDKGNPVHQRLFEQQARLLVAELGLPPGPASRTWEPGPGKVLLAELQHRFDARAFEHLRRQVSTDALLVSTSYWGRNNLWALPPLSFGDVVDAHSYGEEEALGANPHGSHNWIHFMAAAQLAGRPLTVTEWNVPSPARDRFTAPLYVASIGALQGWDALMLYAYNQGPTAAPTRTNKWSAWTDPALIALAPAAAVMYRRGDVAGARQTIVVRPSAQDVFDRRRNAETSVALRTLPERSKMVVALPEVPELGWLRSAPLPEGATVVTDLDRDFLADQPRQVVSDTGELRRDWAAGIQTIDTPRSQAVHGWIGDRRLRTRDATFEIRTPKATVALTALDDRPLAESARVLLTVVARAEPDATERTWMSEPVRGVVAMRSLHADLRLFPLLPTDRVTDAPPARLRGEAGLEGTQSPAADGRTTTAFELPATPATHWYLIVRKP